MHKLKDAQTPEQVGGIPYLSALQDAVPLSLVTEPESEIFWTLIP